MNKIASFALAAVFASGSASGLPISVYDRPEPLDLPALLKTAAGETISDVGQWERTRRPEILDFFTRNMHGVRPVERPADLRFESLGPDKDFLDGKAIRKRTRISFSGPRGAWHFDVCAFLPAWASPSRPAPSFVLLCNQVRESYVDAELRKITEFFPVDTLIERGYAAVVFKCRALACDEYHPSLRSDGSLYVQDPPFTNGLYACWAPERTERSWGAISAWAWGFSRVMDWIETVPAFDAARVAIIGHSRGGKTTLWAGATDPRFALVCVNNSGCCGAKLNHVTVALSETIHVDNANNPHWFCRAFRQFNGRDLVVPFDQHWLAALVAPRLLYIASGETDLSAGPWGEFLTARHASPAWELYGRKGLVEDAPYRAGCVYQAGSIGYHMRKGGHALSLWDWNRYMDFADRHLPAEPSGRQLKEGASSR